MSEFTERACGLLVPVKPPAAPQTPRNILEIQDDDRRKEAVEGMVKVWEALEIGKGHGIGSARYEAHYQAWRHFGEMILGADCPDMEILT